MPQISVSWGTVPVDRLPDECPICHMGIDAVSVISRPVTENDNRRFQTIYMCPRSKCGKAFIADFERLEDRLPLYTLTGLYPSTPVAPVIAPDVAAVSPMFEQIMAQAAAAEAYGLDQVAGMGYRKALEFLIKDYCKLKNPGNDEVIEKIELSVCINNYVKDELTKKVAARAAWLGNDETHYVRKWEDKDIEDLKNLIKITMNFIHNELLADKYITEMTKT